eukprot:UN01421
MSKREEYVKKSMQQNKDNDEDNKMNDNFQNNQQNNQMVNNQQFNQQNNQPQNNQMVNNYANDQMAQNNMPMAANMGDGMRSGYGVGITCDEEGSTSEKTRNLIETAIQSVINQSGQNAKPEDISTALRSVGFMAFIFNGGHGFWWNFECEWSEWSFNDEAYRIVVWKPSQNN